MKRRNAILRFLAHLVSNPWQVHRHFPSQALYRIEQAIAKSETTHLGEIRFVVESGLHPYEIVFGKSPRKRAVELFARLHIWDTEHNNGVLIYLLLADRDVEIVADRGIDARVGHAQWNAICNEMEAMFRHGEFEAGVLAGIEKISALLAQYYPETEQKPLNSSKKRRNELPDKPLIL